MIGFENKISCGVISFFSVKYRDYHQSLKFIFLRRSSMEIVFCCITLSRDPRFLKKIHVKPENRYLKEFKINSMNRDKVVCKGGPGCV